MLAAEAGEGPGEAGRRGVIFAFSEKADTVTGVGPGVAGGGRQVKASFLAVFVCTGGEAPVPAAGV